MNIPHQLSKLEYSVLKGFRGDDREIRELAELKNRKENSGGFFPTTETATKAEDVIDRITDGTKRSIGLQGFEGLALDDALAYTHPYKHFTFFRQAKAIARLARTVSKSGKPSILELGCGGGDMSHFFSVLGVPDYVGVEGNALAFRFSPYILARPKHFHFLNLQQEIDLAHKFSVVCSFEVLEHIPEASLDGIIATVRNHMGPESVFLGTASLQADLDVHVTVKERAFWLQAFAKHGLVPHPREAEWQTDIEQNHAFNWNASNTNVFVLSTRG